MPNPRSIHDQPLRDARHERGLSYRRIATHSGLSESAVRNFLSGQPALPDTLDKLKPALALKAPALAKAPATTAPVASRPPSAQTERALAPFIADQLLGPDPTQSLTCADLLEAADVWCRDQDRPQVPYLELFGLAAALPEVAFDPYQGRFYGLGLPQAATDRNKAAARRTPKLPLEPPTQKGAPMKPPKASRHTAKALRRVLRRLQRCPDIDKLIIGPGYTFTHRRPLGTVERQSDSPHGIGLRVYDDKGARDVFCRTPSPHRVARWLDDTGRLASDPASGDNT